MTHKSGPNPLSPEQVADVIAAVERMTLAEKGQLADRMYEEQPAILAVALAAVRTGVSPQLQDALIVMAMVIFEALREELKEHGPIDESAIDTAAERNVAMWQFLEGEQGDAFRRSVAATLEGYPEPCLIAYVVSRLNEFAEEEQAQVMLQIKSLLDACVQAKWGSAPLPEARRPSA